MADAKKRRRKKQPRKKIPAGIAVFLGVVAALLALLALLIRALVGGGQGGAVAPTPSPTAAASAAAETPEANALPTPAPTAGPGHSPAQAAPDTLQRLGLESIIVQNGARADAYARTPEIHMGLSGEYTDVEGVTTFRGNNYRDSAAHGNIPDDPEELEIVWSVAVSQIDDWGGVGWTGQCAIVRWPEEVVRIMNVREEKQGGPLTEVIYATLDGRIYFLDLYDGQATRPAINIGAPIKGSVTVDPRGYPLLYVGQGIPEVDGRSVDIGTRIFSLIDQELLFFLDGDDPFAQRSWYAFDAAPLVDGATDTMLQVGENALIDIRIATRTTTRRRARSPSTPRWTAMCSAQPSPTSRAWRIPLPSMTITAISSTTPAFCSASTSTRSPASGPGMWATIRTRPSSLRKKRTGPWRSTPPPSASTALPTTKTPTCAKSTP